MSKFAQHLHDWSAQMGRALWLLYVCFVGHSLCSDQKEQQKEFSQKESSAQQDDRHCIQSLQAKLRAHSGGSYTQWKHAALAVAHGQSIEANSAHGLNISVAHAFLASLRDCSGSHRVPCAKVRAQARSAACRDGTPRHITCSREYHSISHSMVQSCHILVLCCLQDPTLPEPSQTQRVLIAVNLRNNAPLMPHFIVQLTAALALLPHGKVFISIYESGSEDSSGGKGRWL